MTYDFDPLVIGSADIYLLLAHRVVVRQAASTVSVI